MSVLKARDGDRVIMRPAAAPVILQETSIIPLKSFTMKRRKDNPSATGTVPAIRTGPLRVGGWKKEGIDLDEIVVPPYLPDNDDVRRDIGDYYAEIQNFDRDVASYLQLVKEMGQLENTLVIVCSDNGWQMPRGLANLYDFGTRIPLIISMPERYKGGRVIDDFVSLNDFAPTFLELAGIPVPETMNARSFVNILESDKEGMVDKERDFIVTARERHAYVRQGGAGYGARAIRTRRFSLHPEL